MERAAYIKAFAEKQYKNVIQAGSAAFGNAATRLETHAVTGGTFT
jgi:peptide/nickel transport system substrate-binding protein